MQEIDIHISVLGQKRMDKNYFNTKRRPLDFNSIGSCEFVCFFFFV